MKVSEMKKDTVKSIRINSEVLELLKDKGLTPQIILDHYIDKTFSVDLKQSLKPE